MRLEQTIRDTVMAESMDQDARLQQLVRAGLMPSNTLPLLRKAIAKVQGGMSLQGSERDVMATFINSMMYIVLGDDTIFNKARAGAKTYATEAKEKQEYDYEGDMAMSQLKSIIANSQRMHDSMSEDTNLPEWVQSKITLAEDYISTASNYMQGEMSEEVEQVDEISKAMAGRYINKAKNSIDLTAWRQGYKEAGAGSPSKHMEKKLSKRHKGIETAVKKLTKEESENLDELSKDTLGRYIKKAATKIGTQGVTAGLKIAKDERSQKNFDTIGKRERGIGKAVSKLTKEDIDAVKKMNESYKTAFDTALTEYGIKSPSELDESKRKEFFNYVDQEFKKGDK